MSKNNSSMFEGLFKELFGKPDVTSKMVEQSLKESKLLSREVLQILVDAANSILSNTSAKRFGAGDTATDEEIVSQFEKLLKVGSLSDKHNRYALVGKGSDPDEPAQNRDYRRSRDRIEEINKQIDAVLIDLAKRIKPHLSEFRGIRDLGFWLYDMIHSGQQRVSVDDDYSEYIANNNEGKIFNYDDNAEEKIQKLLEDLVPSSIQEDTGRHPGEDDLNRALVLAARPDRYEVKDLKQALTVLKAGGPAQASAQIENAIEAIENNISRRSSFQKESKKVNESEEDAADRVEELLNKLDKKSIVLIAKNFPLSFEYETPSSEKDREKYYKDIEGLKDKLSEIALEDYPDSYIKIKRLANRLLAGETIRIPKLGSVKSISPEDFISSIVKPNKSKKKVNEKDDEDTPTEKDVTPEDTGTSEPGKDEEEDKDNTPTEKELNKDIEKEYFASKDEEFYYLSKSEDGTDIVVTDSKGHEKFSAKKANIDIANMIQVIDAAIKAVDVDEMSTDIYQRYIQPELDAAIDTAEEEADDDLEQQAETPESANIENETGEMNDGKELGESKVNEIQAHAGEILSTSGATGIYNTLQNMWKEDPTAYSKIKSQAEILINKLDSKKIDPKEFVKQVKELISSRFGAASESKVKEEYDESDNPSNGWRSPDKDDEYDTTEFSDSGVPAFVFLAALDIKRDLDTSRLGSIKLYKELVDILIDDRKIKQWFENEYDGNSFDLRQTIEEYLDEYEKAINEGPVDESNNLMSDLLTHINESLPKSLADDGKNKNNKKDPTAPKSIAKSGSKTTDPKASNSISYGKGDGIQKISRKDAAQASRSVKKANAHTEPKVRGSFRGQSKDQMNSKGETPSKPRSISIANRYSEPKVRGKQSGQSVKQINKTGRKGFAQKMKALLRIAGFLLGERKISKPNYLALSECLEPELQELYEGLESKAKEVLEAAGFVNGIDFEFSDGLKVLDKDKGFDIVKALDDSGQLGKAIYKTVGGKIIFSDIVECEYYKKIRKNKKRVKESKIIESSALVNTPKGFYLATQDGDPESMIPYLKALLSDAKDAGGNISEAIDKLLKSDGLFKKCESNCKADYTYKVGEGSVSFEKTSESKKKDPFINAALNTGSQKYFKRCSFCKKPIAADEYQKFRGKCSACDTKTKNDSKVNEELSKTVADYSIENHGITRSDYFEGAGISGSDWDDVATGIGSSEHEAVEDALEMLAQNGWNVDKISNEEDNTKTLSDAQAENDMHFFVSVYVKGGSEADKSKVSEKIENKDLEGKSKDELEQLMNELIKDHQEDMDKIGRAIDKGDASIKGDAKVRGEGTDRVRGSDQTDTGDDKIKCNNCGTIMTKKEFDDRKECIRCGEEENVYSVESDRGEDSKIREKNSLQHQKLADAIKKYIESTEERSEIQNLYDNFIGDIPSEDTDIAKELAELAENDEKIAQQMYDFIFGSEDDGTYERKIEQAKKIIESLSQDEFAPVYELYAGPVKEGVDLKASLLKLAESNKEFVSELIEANNLES